MVFANAGVNGVWAPIERLEPDEWRETLAINLNGTFFTIKYSAGTLSHDKMLRCVELYGREVIPRVRKLLGSQPD